MPITLARWEEIKAKGSYKDKKDALVARLKAERELFGVEFAPQRHLFKEYGIDD